MSAGVRKMTNVRYDGILIIGRGSAGVREREIQRGRERHDNTGNPSFIHHDGDKVDDDVY